jgi:hypothetical protein
MSIFALFLPVGSQRCYYCRRENLDFMLLLSSSWQVLVHGDTIEMGRLKAALLQRYEGTPRKLPLHSLTVLIFALLKKF